MVIWHCTIMFYAGKQVCNNFSIMKINGIYNYNILWLHENINKPNPCIYTYLTIYLVENEFYFWTQAIEQILQMGH